MIYLKLQEDKILKLNQSTPIYQGEHLADSIKINIPKIYCDNNYTCFLNILTSIDNAGDYFIIENDVEYPIDNKFLNKNQELILWIEIRVENKLIKSSEVRVKVNEHHEIESIVSDAEISVFEQLMREAAALHQDTLKLKEEIDKSISEIPQTIPSISKENIISLFYEEGENLNE